MSALKKTMLLFAAVISASSGAVTAANNDPRDDFRRPATIPFPADAPYSPQAAALGKLLFFDPRLSGAQNVSCASCHNPSFGWEVPVPRALGSLAVELARHVPTVENLAEAPRLTWDGRQSSIERQVLSPIVHPDEMNATMEQVVSRLLRIPKYRKAFRTAYPGEGLVEENVIASLATYLRTLRSGWSPFDDWVAGDEGAISPAAKRGFAFFIGEGAVQVVTLAGRLPTISSMTLD